ncbi:MAG: type II secretion system protein GspM [Bryobacteraceae bacterium]
MTVGKLDRRSAALLALGVGFVLVLRFGVYDDRPPAAVAPRESTPAAEQRLERLRQLVSLVPAKSAELKQAAADLAAREKGMLAADTAAQAQAQLLELLRRVGQKNGIQVRGAEELKARALSSEYGEVAVTVAFTCGIEQMVNLLADLSNEPQLVATNEVRISSGNAKEKTIGVRLGVCGIVPRKLIPEKKGTF